jgi:cytochrome oxidase Cu insertion factor (SCO1/SenC/PrrC family)
VAWLRRLVALLLAAQVASVTTAEAASPPTPGAPAPATEAAREAKARAWFTDTVLLDQRGQPLKFYSDVVAGKVVCVAFIFTTCREACPLLMSRLNRIKASLGGRFGGEVTFVAISVDPENDTPAALQAFAAKHGAAVPGWTFLTGSRADLATVAGKLGGWAESPDQHTTAFVAGNARTRHWTKVRPDTSPEAVAELLRGLADEG